MKTEVAELPNPLRLYRGGAEVLRIDYSDRSMEYAWRPRALDRLFVVSAIGISRIFDQDRGVQVSYPISGNRLICSCFRPAIGRMVLYETEV